MRLSVAGRLAEPVDGPGKDVVGDGGVADGVVDVVCFLQEEN